MSKKSRVRLWISILTCEGLLTTLAERVKWSPRLRKREKLLERAGSSGLPHYDYAGALHIHSTYSDGLGTISDIAQAANRAGLDFVIMNDHSNLDAIIHHEDGWHGQSLILIGTEITTDQGHLLALNVPTSLLPTSNNAQEAQQAIQQSGGFGFIALPCDLKDHWKDFSQRRESIGLEVFNLSAIARTKISVPGFLLALLRYRGSRPQRSFHLVSSRPGREIRLWDQLISPQGSGGAFSRVVGIGSLDAHAVMKVARRKYPFPTYEELFRTLRTHVVTTAPLSKNNAQSSADQAVIHDALKSGHCYIAYDNYGNSSGFRFEAISPLSAHPFRMGDLVTLPESASSQSKMILSARTPRKRTLFHLYKDGAMIASARGDKLIYETREPGAYRIEAYLYRHRIGRLCLGVKPWIFSNPIYLCARSAADKS